MKWLCLVVVCAAAGTTVADPAPPATPAPQPADGADPVLGHAARVMGNEAKDVVAFTFDDGPNPKTTPIVIAALEKYDVPATFFIITQKLAGKHGAKGREVLAQEIAGGFIIGDHSRSHPNLKKVDNHQLGIEIDGSIHALAAQAGRPIGLFRPPYGALSGAGRMHLKRLGVTEVIWSIDTLDWRASNPERLRAKVMRMILKQRGGIVLMHDRRQITAKVIPEILDDLEAENCRRLATGGTPIVPVSIHYFLRDGNTPRPIPDEVKARTAAYLKALPARCAARTPPIVVPVPPAPAPAAPTPPAR